MVSENHLLPKSCLGVAHNECLLGQLSHDDLVDEDCPHDCAACGINLEAADSRLSEALQLEPTREEIRRDSGSARAVAAVCKSLSFKKAPPEQLGPYEIRDRIGGGSMGTVYHARHVHLQTDFAIKLLKVSPTEGSRTVARFKREMRALGQMNHPHIVRATDAGESDGAYFITMEYLRGDDLGRVLRRNGVLPSSVACEVVRQAALGVQYAHEQGVVHRDIKPSNLILAKEKPSEAPVVKVVDFGLIREYTPQPTTDADDDLTPAGLILGTVGYMAPEQQMDPRQVSPQSDVFSLGAVLCCLITGSVSSLLHHERDLIPAIEQIVDQATATDPAKRIESARALADALQQHCEGADLEALLKT
ncbi:MAG: serine/threonine protein kinase [Planctomycetaceae bacterium]